MSELFTFAGNHPFLTWMLAWGIWPVCWTIQAVLTAPIKYPYYAYKRRLRSKDIQARGWPTAPLMDADGDIIHKPSKDK